MSMISEQVKKLRKLANQWKHNDVAGYNLMFDACDTIEALSAKVRNNNLYGGWIPVSERLPIPPTFCLVTTDGSHGDVIDIALYMSDGWHKASEVIAWMPLPSPYEGGESE